MTSTEIALELVYPRNSSRATLGIGDAQTTRFEVVRSKPDHRAQGAHSPALVNFPGPEKFPTETNAVGPAPIEGK